MKREARREAYSFGKFVSSGPGNQESPSCFQFWGRDEMVAQSNLANNSFLTTG